MSNEEPNHHEKFELALIRGDLSKLTEVERLTYYMNVCKSLGLNPLTKPFAYLTLNGRLTLYAQRDCTDQLRNKHGISVSITGREVVNDCYVVTAKATASDGRCDESIGAVAINNLAGDKLCNAMMKAETKAKRRVTLSICGLGLTDESEVETIHGAVTHEPELPPLPPPAATKKQTKIIDPKIHAVALLGCSNIQEVASIWATIPTKDMTEDQRDMLTTLKDDMKLLVSVLPVIETTTDIATLDALKKAELKKLQTEAVHKKLREALYARTEQLQEESEVPV